MLACSAEAEAALLLAAGPEADGLFMCPECCVIDSVPFDLGFLLQFRKDLELPHWQQILHSLGSALLLPLCVNTLILQMVQLYA